MSKLREFIKKTVKIGDDKELLYQIDNGKIKPSKSLQDSIKSMIEGNQEFVMLDDQKVVYEEILSNANVSNKGAAMKLVMPELKGKAENKTISKCVDAFLANI